MVTKYEQRRQKNIEDNKRILAELGLLNPYKLLPKVIKNTCKRKYVSPGGSKPRKLFIVTSLGSERNELEEYEASGTPSRTASSEPRRRSLRIKGIQAESESDVKNQFGDVTVEDRPVHRAPANRPNIYGPVPGIEVGTWWMTRLEANVAGIHRPTVAGIHGGPEGAYSIALSGGYEDDIDLGECFTYTGEGGRDLKGTKAKPKNLRTAPQSKEQTLTKGNLALSLNVSSGHPVRVIRGYKLHSAFAPEEGYRYDGLYKVDKFWFTTGLSGFGVYKFVLHRLPNQAPPPWTLEKRRDESEAGSSAKEGREEIEAGHLPKKRREESEARNPPKERREESEAGSPPKERRDESDTGSSPKERRDESETGSSPKERREQSEAGSSSKERSEESEAGSPPKERRDESETGSPPKESRDESESGSLPKESREESEAVSPLKERREESEAGNFDCSSSANSPCGSEIAPIQKDMTVMEETALNRANSESEIDVTNQEETTVTEETALNGASSESKTGVSVQKKCKPLITAGHKTQGKRCLSM